MGNKKKENQEKSKQKEIKNKVLNIENIEPPQRRGPKGNSIRKF